MELEEGRDGRAPEGAFRHADPHARGAGPGVVPEPLAQLPAGGSSRRQGRGTALRHLRALPHGGQDLLVPDDARPLGEAPRLPPRARADGHPADARDALDRRGRRGARVPRDRNCLTARHGRRRPQSSTAPGPCSVTSPAAARTGARSRITDAGNAEYKLDRQPHLRRRHLRDLRRRGHALRRLRAAHADEEQRLRRQRRLSSFPATRFAASGTSRPRTFAPPARNGCAAAAAPGWRASFRRSSSRERRPRSPSRG